MTENTTVVFDSIVEHINSMPIPEDAKCDVLKKLSSLRQNGINIMITGATGSGKSSTINALFRADKAKVGISFTPETMDIDQYDYDGMILWDTPGLGDGEEADKRHSNAIVAKLNERDAHGNMLIDAVLVILDASSRDLGTSYKLINETIIPNLNDKNRIIVALNKVDMVGNRKLWNHSTNMPEPSLIAKLDEQVAVVRKRIAQSTGVDVTPILYSAGDKDDDSDQTAPYNLAKLLAALLRCIPPIKRMPIIDNISTKKENYAVDDGRANYKEEVVDAFRQTGGAIGETIGSVLGPVGKVVGKAIGEFLGSVVSKLFSWW